MNENTLWIEVRESDGAIEARLCDLSIAARGRDKDHLLGELAHAITVLYEVATELGETPFLRFVTEVPILEAMKRQAFKGDSFGSIELPHHVAVALSAVLRIANPIDRISLIQRAKAA